MTKDLKFDLVIKEIIAALGYGVGGAVLCSITVSLVLGWVDLFASIIYVLMAGYIGMLTGIGIVGYKHFNRNGRQKSFLKHFIQGLLGFAVGLLGLYVITWYARTLELPNALINFFIIGLPLIGTMIGFNYNLSNGAQKTGDAASH